MSTIQFQTTTAKLQDENIVMKYQNSLAYDAFGNVICFDPRSAVIVEDRDTRHQFKEHLRLTQGVIFSDETPNKPVSILNYLDELDREKVDKDITIQYVREFDYRTGNFFLFECIEPFHLPDDLYRRLITEFCRRKHIPYSQIRLFASSIVNKEKALHTTVYEA